MRASKVDEIVASDDSPFVAVVDIDCNVSIWNLSTGRKISEFRSFWDIGGQRLAISKDGCRCAVGAWNRYGITMHDTTQGRILWQRKELKKVQSMKFSRYLSALFAEIDMRAFHIVDTESGETLEKMRGIEGICESPFEKIELLERKSAGLEIVEFDSKTTIFKIARMSFAVLDALFTKRSVVVWESGHYPETTQSISCYSLKDGDLIWRYQVPKDSLLRGLGYRQSSAELLAIKDYKTLLTFDESDGKLRKEIPIGDAGRSAFAIGGSLLVTWTGKVHDTITGRTVLNLEFPLMRSDKDTEITG